MTDKIIVLTTASDKKEAEDIAWGLVERKLAACVNILAAESVYRWKGEVESHPEHVLLIKTTATSFNDLCEALTELSSYDVPECIQLNIEGGTPSYLEWIGESLK